MFCKAQTEKWQSKIEGQDWILILKNSVCASLLCSVVPGDLVQVAVGRECLLSPVTVSGLLEQW